MAYKVIDPKGVGYTDDSGVKIIQFGHTLDDQLIEQGLFTRECIDRLVRVGRIELKEPPKVSAPPAPAAPIISPANKKAVIPSGKAGGKKKGAK